MYLVKSLDPETSMCPTGCHDRLQMAESWADSIPPISWSFLQRTYHSDKHVHNSASSLQPRLLNMDRVNPLFNNNHPFGNTSNLATSSWPSSHNSMVITLHAWSASKTDPTFQKRMAPSDPPLANRVSCTGCHATAATRQQHGRTHIPSHDKRELTISGTKYILNLASTIQTLDIESET